MRLAVRRHETVTHFHSDCCALFRRSGGQDFRVSTWRVTEPLPKLSCEMSVVAKAASVGDFAERLGYSQ